MEKNTGGPAFPEAKRVINGEFSYLEVKEGMTLRDYLAGQAIVGDNSDANVTRLAEKAYQIADAMLAERGK